MIQCPAQSQVQWRTKTLTVLKNITNKTTQWKFELNETMCLCLSEWFKTGEASYLCYLSPKQSAIIFTVNLSIFFVPLISKSFINLLHSNLVFSATLYELIVWSDIQSTKHFYWWYLLFSFSSPSLLFFLIANTFA